MSTLALPGRATCTLGSRDGAKDRRKAANARATAGQQAGRVNHALKSSQPLDLNARRENKFSNAGRCMTLMVSASAAKASGAPLKVIISGAPASGKGTQCEEIVSKFGLVHISAGDLLRAEVAGGTENGKVAKSFMDAGKLVPDIVVNNIVKDRLSLPDAAAQGWLLDGYPRSASQADALVKDGIVPDVFIQLNVPNDVIVQRVAGRRLDPITGKIYHLIFNPPPNDPEILGRLVQRSDDNEEKIKARLQTYDENNSSVLSLYKEKIKEVDGNRPKEVVFGDISNILTSVQESKALSTKHVAQGAPI